MVVETFFGGGPVEGDGTVGTIEWFDTVETDDPEIEALDRSGSGLVYRRVSSLGVLDVRSEDGRRAAVRLSRIGRVGLTNTSGLPLWNGHDGSVEVWWKEGDGMRPVNVGEWTDDDWEMYEAGELRDDPDVPECAGCQCRTWDLMPSLEDRGDVCIGCAKQEDNQSS